VCITKIHEFKAGKFPNEIKKGETQQKIKLQPTVSAQTFSMLSVAKVNA